MFQARTVAAQICRFGVCGAILIGAGAANWIDPAPIGESETGPPTASSIAPPSPLRASALIGRQIAAAPEAAVASSGLAVMRWGFSDRPAAQPNQPPQGTIAAGRPLYLWLVLDGTQAAVNDMRANQGLAIEVHWMRDSSSGAPDLVTPLTVGRPGLAGIFEQQVRTKGFFEWHSWARKDTLSPGPWTVSLTYPNGRPLLCGSDAQPCRFKINAG
jgi:hypothetical protein